ncbi:hypothetical protein T4E_5687 [Trichinella pseudospiralis]|uniref:Uncharacterized protein n=1 Tax=Trichinella pseudospiralis TaxID=6337 RepID=A0A0V0XIN8_TRIPS|nr:hypothetical protein T4E_5687 [Trichinella pseudospiralis]
MLKWASVRRSVSSPVVGMLTLDCGIPSSQIDWRAIANFCWGTGRRRTVQNVLCVIRDDERIGSKSSNFGTLTVLQYGCIALDVEVPNCKAKITFDDDGDDELTEQDEEEEEEVKELEGQQLEEQEEEGDDASTIAAGGDSIADKDGRWAHRISCALQASTFRNPTEQ